MNDKVINTSLTCIKHRLKQIYNSLDEMIYWNSLNDDEVMELVNNDINKSYRILQKHLNRVENEIERL
jgi:hypothetical protein